MDQPVEFAEPFNDAHLMIPRIAQNKCIVKEAVPEADGRISFLRNPSKRKSIDCTRLGR